MVSQPRVNNGAESRHLVKPSTTSRTLTEAIEEAVQLQIQQEVGDKLRPAVEQARKEKERAYQATREVFDKLRRAFDDGTAELDDAAAEELAQLANLLVDIETTDYPRLRSNPNLISAVGFAVDALLTKKPMTKLAVKIRRNIHRDLNPWPFAGLYRSLRNSVRSSPTTVVVVGLAILFFSIIFLALYFSGFRLNSGVFRDTLGVEPSMLVLVGTAGALGSIVSIMVRIKDLEYDIEYDKNPQYAEEPDPWPFLFFGLFKPIVGAVFALFVFAAINATLLPLNVPKEPILGWFFVTLAFVAGFSERFAGDVITSTEHTVGGTPSIPQRSSPLLREGGGEKVSSSETSAEVPGKTQQTSPKSSQDRDVPTEPNK